MNGSRGAVAAENRVCSKIGTSLLKDGGSAADAAIGATLCVGVLNMFSSGIGGGGFALIRAPRSGAAFQDKADHSVVDFRETAPAASFEGMFRQDPEKSKVGGLAIGTPGELRGLEEIWRRWGKLQWHQLVEPSIKLARQARVGKELARRLKFLGFSISQKPEWEEIFLNPKTGRFLEEGDNIRRPAYARTLEAVAQNGSDAFYHGPIAEAMIEKVQAAGGALTLQDLAEYKVEVREALGGSWICDKKVWTTPAPTGGPVLLAMMNLLKLLGFEEESRHRRKSGRDTIEHKALWSHRLVEVYKHGYAARTRLGDPAFLNETWLQEISQIPRMSRAHQILPKINDTTTFGIDHYEPIFDSVEDYGTTHISAIDADGMSVGITSTVNLIFGSQVLDPKTGVIFNDEMDDTSTPGVPNAFGLYPSPFNYPQPGKRPLSSISPIIIEDEHGLFEMLLGAAGGSRIPSSVLASLLNICLGMDLSEAIEAPRLHHQLLPPIVAAESTFDEDVIRSLVQRGHQVLTTDINWGLASVQGVERDAKSGHVRASSDSRKAGWADAY